MLMGAEFCGGNGYRRGDQALNNKVPVVKVAALLTMTSAASYERMLTTSCSVRQVAL